MPLKASINALKTFVIVVNERQKLRMFQKQKRVPTFPSRCIGFTEGRTKIIRYFQKGWRLEILTKYSSSCLTNRKNQKTLNYKIQVHTKMQIRTSLWKTAYQIESSMTFHKMKHWLLVFVIFRFSKPSTVYK